ncbi:hypothetical protein [Microbacterium sp. KR10-403]|uniref:hypothetical protein n=1 Tax=Microbacterium sp. KR10-403 TaxID=3158581 RepID=UPI0032E46174
MRAHEEHRAWPTWVIVGVGVVLTIGALIWTGTQYDSHGSRLIDGPLATVLVAVLGSIGTTVALVLQRSGVIRHQVQNSHGTNLRVDLDEIKSAVGAVASDVRGIRKDHGRLASRLDATAARLDHTNSRLDTLADHVDDIEDTIIPRKDDKS